VATPKPKDEPETTRLTDMRVHEVSFVDRAANKRRFLLTKRDDDMSKLVADGRGGFVLKADGKEDESGKKEGEETAEKGKADPKKEEKEGDGKKEGEETAEKGKADPKKEGEEEEGKEEKAKKSTVAKLNATAERILDVAKAVSEGKEIPEGFADEVAKMAAACSGAEVKKSESKQEPTAELVELTKKVGELAETVSKQAKTIESQSEEIKKLSAEPGDSRARSPEGVAKGAGDHVAWPSDLNRSQPKETF